MRAVRQHAKTAAIEVLFAACVAADVAAAQARPDGDARDRPMIVRDYDDPGASATTTLNPRRVEVRAPNIIRSFDGGDPTTSTSTSTSTSGSSSAAVPPRTALRIETEFWAEPVIEIHGAPPLPAITVTPGPDWRRVPSAASPRRRDARRAATRRQTMMLSFSLVGRPILLGRRTDAATSSRGWIGAVGASLAIEGRVARRTYFGGFFEFASVIAPSGGGSQVRLGATIAYQLVRSSVVVPSAYLATAMSFLGSGAFGFALEAGAGLAIDFVLARHWRVFAGAGLEAALAFGRFVANEGLAGRATYELGAMRTTLALGVRQSW